MHRAKGVVGNYWCKKAEAGILRGSGGGWDFLEEVEICEDRSQ